MIGHSHCYALLLGWRPQALAVRAVEEQADEISPVYVYTLMTGYREAAGKGEKAAEPESATVGTVRWDELMRANLEIIVKSVADEYPILDQFRDSFLYLDERYCCGYSSISANISKFVNFGSLTFLPQVRPTHPAPLCAIIDYVLPLSNKRIENNGTFEVHNADTS